MQGDVAALSVEFIEAVKNEDEARVREILTSPLAAEVAVKVAVLAAIARTQAAAADREVRRARAIEAQFRQVGAANRALIAERAGLRERLAAYRKGQVAA